MSKQPKEPDLYGRDSDDEAGEVPGGTYIPPDQPMGSNSWGTTSAENRLGETFDQRTKHLEPEDEANADPDAVGRLAQIGDEGVEQVDDDEQMYGSVAGDDDLSAEESAVHFTSNP